MNFVAKPNTRHLQDESFTAPQMSPRDLGEQNPVIYGAKSILKNKLSQYH